MKTANIDSYEKTDGVKLFMVQDSYKIEMKSLFNI